MYRVLVTEEISQTGLDMLTEAGHQVDISLGLSPEELIAAAPGAHAIIVRSATQITPEVIEAGSDLVVVGRAGVGLDNVDVASATERGVLVCNAPQANIVSAAEHAIALMLSLARNIPQAHEALSAGRWERSRWTGTEILDSTVGVVGLGRVGELVARRMAAFGAKLVAYDPYVSKDRARDLGVTMLSLDELMARSDFITVHLPKTPETVDLINSRTLGLCKPSARLVNTARGGIVNEGDLTVALEAGTIAGAAIDVFAIEPTTESGLFGRDDTIVTPHLGASTHEAQDKAGVTIAEMVNLALANQFVPFAVNLAASEAPEDMRQYLPLAGRLGAFLAGMVGEVPSKLEIRLVGELATFDREMLTLSIVRGLLSPLLDEPVTFVNGFEIAERLGLEISNHPPAGGSDFVNLIEVRADGHSVAGTLVGERFEPRIVMLDDHDIELPLASNMLVIRNDDRPGVIGSVGSTLGDAQVNVSYMALGRSSEGVAALMAIATDEPISSETMAALVADASVRSVARINLG
ncbi:MAG: D-3-phosphoglycerate dehydrogenase [Candidatus Poriferisodalaceae bacterium]|jgi:D-3-phosphoglycerate dehydrogenase